MSDTFEKAKTADAGFARWTRSNLHEHKVDGYTTLTVSLKPMGIAPGDATDTQMELVAELAETYGYDDIRVTHAQNLVLAHVALDDVYEVYRKLDAAGLGTANEGLISDMIVCPGLDYCNLANARSIPVGMAIQEAFSDPDDQADIGKFHINISGCINACGHHHVGHVGILGVDRKGEEYYQITLGGRADEKAAIGAVAGPGVKADEVPVALKRLVNKYRELRTTKDETFIETLERTGMEPFKEAIYAAD